MLKDILRSVKTVFIPALVIIFLAGVAFMWWNTRHMSSSSFIDLSDLRPLIMTIFIVYFVGMGITVAVINILLMALFSIGKQFPLTLAQRRTIRNRVIKVGFILAPITYASNYIIRNWYNSTIGEMIWATLFMLVVALIGNVVVAILVWLHYWTMDEVEGVL